MLRIKPVLSRIWGGIHPPIDDVRGRLIGEKIGVEAYNMSISYFNGTLSDVVYDENLPLKIFPGTCSK